jgi:hypothetical protein
MKEHTPVEAGDSKATGTTELSDSESNKGLRTMVLRRQSSNSLTRLRLEQATPENKSLI